MVLNTAHQDLDSLAQDAGNDRALTLELSTAYLRLADVEGRPSASCTGDTEAALKNYDRGALMLRRQLVTLDPGNTDYQHNLAVALVRMGPIFQVKGDPQNAVIRTREAMQIMDRLVQRAPGPDIRRDAFRAPLYFGDALADLGDYTQALLMYRKALAAADTARRDPPVADYKHRLADQRAAGRDVHGERRLSAGAGQLPRGAGGRTGDARRGARQCRLQPPDGQRLLPPQ